MIAYLIKTGMNIIIMSPARDNRQAWMHMQKGEATKLGQQYILILFFFFFCSQRHSLYCSFYSVLYFTAVVQAEKY